MTFISYGCGKKIIFSSFANFQLFPQVCHAGRKIAGCQIGLLNISQHHMQSTFAEITPSHNVEDSSGEVFEKLFVYEKMTVRMQFLQSVIYRERILNSCFHNGGVGFVEKYSFVERIGLTEVSSLSMSTAASHGRRAQAPCCRCS